MQKITSHFKPLIITMYCFLLSFYLQGCYGNPCGDDYQSVNTNYLISDANKAAIPYRPDGKDTLIYISDAGDTAILYGVGIKQYTNRVSRRRNSDPDCPEIDYDYCENLEYTYQGAKGKDLHSLSFRAYLWLANTSPDLYEQMGEFTINYYEKSGSFGEDNIPGNSLGYLNGSLYFYYSKVSLKGKDYWGAPVAKKEIYKKVNIDTLVIYNKDYGVIQLFINNQKWKLSF